MRPPEISNASRAFAVMFVAYGGTPYCDADSVIACLGDNLSTLPVSTHHCAG
jgi:hypothetical protein